MVDGTHVNFFQCPAVDGETFFNRKGRYSMNVQLMCDDRRKITYYVVGWPGSVYDGTVLGNSNLVKQPELYFSPQEFALADAGFAATWFLLTPYRHPAAVIPCNQLYNNLISSARQIIEHVNGILKGRFQSLNNVRISVREKEDLLKFCNWVVACLVLHNMLLRYNDGWDEEFVEEDVNENALDITPHDAHANDLRGRVQNYVLNWYHNL